MTDQETFYYYDISGLKELRESNLNITALQYDNIALFKIAVKRGDKYYDVVSSVPLTADLNASTGIYIENLREATRNEIIRVASNVACTHESTIRRYRETMRKIHERIKEDRKELEASKRLLSKLALKIGSNDIKA